PNAIGIYDMSGNVAELTYDQFVAEAYASGDVENPLIESGEGPTVRGGGWFSKAPRQRCTNRFRTYLHKKHDHIGFRLVRIK
ncbi:MAG: SUMF1/EgtB/PvdO family nonheme iron enzyme, partial [Gammaproteobacteria bacterium]|nr:SUMF1/EgtB/PvdO family nonheme iron enzyme [Gammaproteobacteria bacterium]